MAHIACLVCLVSTVSGHFKKALGRGSVSSGHITKLEQSTFLRYQWFHYCKTSLLCTSMVGAHLSGAPYSIALYG